MTNAFDASFVSSNLQGLGALRNEADTPEARRAVAKQFEGLFLSLMIKQMRSASAIEGGLIDNDRMELQQNLFDEQLALSMARGRGVGLADAILRSWGDDPSTLPPQSAVQAVSMPTRVADAGPSSALARMPDPLGGGETTLPVEALVAADEPALKADTPAEFVESVWPYAERAASSLGVGPDVLVAQAALETGWGRRLPENQHGQSSLNLFGIKAGPDWAGPKATIRTLEYVDGIAERRNEPFRMYSSLHESFSDYVRFVRRSPRYMQALAATSNEGYVRGLQQGGYATDPKYADKILGILARGLPGRAGPQSHHDPASSRADGATASSHRLNDGDLQ